MVGRQDVELGQDAHVLKVAVGEDAGRIFPGHKFIDDMLWERGSPQHGAVFAGEPHASHAFTRGVTSTNGSRTVRNELCDPSGALG